MINITKNGNSVVVTNDSNYAFPFQDGVLTVPVNSLTYTLETESDYIAFRSAANNDVLFSASLQDIRINGATVTRDNFVNQFNAVAYAAVSGGNGGASDAPTYTAGDGIEISSDNVIGLNVTQSTSESSNKTRLYSLYKNSGGQNVTSEYFSIECDDDTLKFIANGNYAKLRINTDVVALKTDIVSQWVGTQAEYDALGTYQSNVIYNIIEG